MDEYRTEAEARYFGSDLNKFIHFECSKKMDTINIDCLQYRADQFRFRLIESKHMKEKLSKRQNVLYRMMARFFKFIWSGKLLEIFTVYGNYPYKKLSL